MAQRAIVRTIPAPVGGLNDINSIADMPPTDALIMDNIFPGTNSCSLRGGSVQWVSGIGAIGETLLAYNGINSKKLFVAAGTSIIDVTTDGTAGAAVLSGKSNARWDYVNFGGNAGNHLVAVNSADLPIYYNGTTWAVSGSGFATAITGVDASLFSSVAMFKNRLYFVEKNSLKCWYLGTNSIGGAANVLNFSGVARLGGKLVAITTIPTSAGSSLDDYFCAITSEGELLVYAGTDPASVSTFALVGVYRVGRPVANGSAVEGSRFIEKMGSDMIAITVDGFTTLQSALNNDVVAQSTTINKKIVNSVTRDTGQYKQNFGWQIVLAPNNNKLLINVPIGNGEYYQYVMNTITGAWCRFTGLNAYCWAYWDDQLWAVIGSAVYKTDVKNANDFVHEVSTLHNPVWTRIGTVTWSCADLSDDSKYLLGCKDSNYLSVSSNSGATWTDKVYVGYGYIWMDCAISSDGLIQIAVSKNDAIGGKLYISYDHGASWAENISLGNGDWNCCCMSPDGQTIIVSDISVSVTKKSTNAGVSWTTIVARSFWDVGMSSDGSIIAGVEGLPNSKIYVSTNYGTTFTAYTLPDSSIYLYQIALSDDGTFMAACGNGYIYTSTNAGANWTKQLGASNHAWSGISISKGTGRIIAMIGTSSYIKLSDDNGVTWADQTSAGLRNYFARGGITYDGNGMLVPSDSGLFLGQ